MKVKNVADIDVSSVRSLLLGRETCWATSVRLPRRRRRVSVRAAPKGKESLRTWKLHVFLAVGSEIVAL